MIRVIKAGLISCLLIAGAPTQADGVMKDIFYDTMVSTETPGGYRSATRQGFNLGGAQVRYRTRQLKLVTFSPPRIRAGCGGIDAFAGAFSMISGEQLVQSARALAQGAATYAFGLAIDAMCPSCAAEMKHLNKWLNELNKFASTSCKDAGEMIANTEFMQGLKAEGASREASVLPNLLPLGMFDDFMDGKNQPNASNAEDIQAAGMQKEASYNIMWHALKSANLENFEVDGVDSLSFMEIIMSMTGTMVKCYDATLCGNGVIIDSNSDDGSVTKYFSGTISFKTLILGPEADGGASDKVLMLRCSDPVPADRTNHCLEVKEVEENFKGLKELLLEIIWGDTPYPAPSTGFVGAIQGRSTPMTQVQMNLLSHSGMDVTNILRATLRDNMATPVTYQVADLIAEKTAVSAARNWLGMINKKVADVSSVKPGTDKQFVNPADVAGIKARAEVLNAQKISYEAEMQTRLQSLVEWLETQKFLMGTAAYVNFSG